MAAAGSVIVCDRLRLYGNSSLCDHLRSAIRDRLRSYGNQPLRVRREYANLPSPPPFTSCHCLHKAHGVLAYGLEMKLLYLIVHRRKQFSRLATKSFFVCKFRLLQTELLMLPPLRQKVFLLYALCQNKTK